MERITNAQFLLKHISKPNLTKLFAWLSITVASIGVALILGSTPSYALPASPAYNADFPDPFIMTDGGKYWAYSTGTNILNLRVMSSPDLVNWTNPVEPLPVQPRWARSGSTWAPSVIHIGNSYLMYYTTRSVAYNRQCISVATSSNPAGPFKDTSSGPLVCQASLGGSIDPNVYKAPNGALYLYWKSDGSAIGQVSSIWGRQLASNGKSFANFFQSPTKILTASSPWQNNNIESPTMTFFGGQYYLFYSGNIYDNPNYGVGYATCTGLLGTCTNQSTAQAWLGNNGNIVGPGAGNVFTDLTGATRLSFHSWMNGVGYPNGGYRAMWIGGLSYANGVPQLQ
jgi:hypothetical protein